jgi:energy-coupling factor transporter ATP-binding protein EcfA2
MDMLKNQIVTISAMQGGKDGSSIMNAIYGIILLSFIEQIFKYLPVIGAFFKKYSEEYIKRRYGSINIVNTLGNLKKELTGSIILEKSYLDKDSGQNSEFVEAILEHISKLPNIKFLKYRTRFFVSHKDEFEIENNICGRCIDYIQSIETGELEKITIQVYSYTMDIVQLRAFLNNIHKNFLISKKNQLGDQTYFFDHMISQSTIPILRFDMTPFNTNKSLKTIYGSYMSNIVKRINFFIKNRDWYIKKGIPHTLGLLLHGPPGCGKTSLIKAIANDTHRHIINIQLNKQVTQSQLKSLFFNEEIFVFNKKTGQNELFLIPLEQRIYVMEDVDAISDILYSRDVVNKQREIEDKVRQETYEEARHDAIKKGYAPPPPPQNIKEDNKEQLTLAFILNLLDGILETPGRIIILTTNHPEKLDSALVRPGRIDLDIHFNRCSRETIVELVIKFYETINEASKEWCDFLSKLGKLDEYMLTPAEVNKIIFNYYNEPTLAFDEIIGEIQKHINKCVEEERKDAKLGKIEHDITDLVKTDIASEACEEGEASREIREAHSLEKLYLSTRDCFKQLFGKEYIKFLEEKMLLVQDTLLISKQVLENIYICNRDSVLNGLLELEEKIKNNRKSILKSSNVLYEVHEDKNGKFIYVDLETLNTINNNLESHTKKPVSYGEEAHNKELYNTTNVVGFSGNGNFLGFNANNFESIDGSEANSSLDDFFRPIL